MSEANRLQVDDELETEIDKAVENVVTASPFCLNCKQLREEIRFRTDREHEIGEQIKLFYEFLKSFERN